MARITVGGVVVRDVGVATNVEVRQGEQVRISFDFNLGTQDAPQPADLSTYAVDCQVKRYAARSVIGASATGLELAGDGSDISLQVSKDGGEPGRAWVLVPKDLDTSDIALDAASGLPVYAGFVRFAKQGADAEIDFAPIMVIVRKGIV